VISVNGLVDKFTTGLSGVMGMIMVG
jgi:hypothetical protein